MNSSKNLPRSLSLSLITKHRKPDLFSQSSASSRIWQRFESNSAASGNPHTGKNSLKYSEYFKDPVKLIVLPITNEKLFIYYKHVDSFLNTNSKLVKYETMISKKAAQIWNKLETSDKSYNVYIVKWANRFLNQIQWQEHSLVTIPSQNHILKKVRQESDFHRKNPDKLKISMKEYMTYVESQTSGDNNRNNNIKNLELNTDGLQVSEIVEPIKLYYPDSILTKKDILKEMESLAHHGIKYHKKQMIYNVLALPLTFPVILIPLLPNVPGFYLAYRFYCNMKAYLGAKHLLALCKDEPGNFLRFENLEEYSNIFQSSSETPHLLNDKKHSNFVLTEPHVSKIVEELDIPEIKKSLVKAINQENSTTNRVK